jgi:hypothetical protein
MKNSRLIFIWLFGVTCGIILINIIQAGHSPLVKMSIVNKSSIFIDRAIIEDIKYNNKYLIENLDLDDSSTTSLYTKGENLYKLTIHFNNNNDQLNTTVYAEPGYHNQFIVKLDTIEYFPRFYN